MSFYGLPLTLREAKKRVGHTSEDMMRWAIRFSGEYLAGRSRAQILEITRELAAFSMSSALLIEPGDSLPWRRISTGRAPHGVVPRLEKLEQYQERMKDIINEVLVVGMVSVRTPSVTHHLRWEPSGAESRKLSHVIIETDDPEEPYTMALVQLLMRHGALLRKCEECEQIFLAERGHQTYCSVTCQSRAGTRRYRTQRGMITGRPRGRPPKRHTSLTAIRGVKQPRRKR
jgi:hypothetical protein